MEAEEYKLMYDLEETHWWYRGLRDLLYLTIQDIFSGNQKKINILDAGCGTGFLLKQLGRYEPSFGIDISSIALKYCHMRGLNRIAKSSILTLPFPNESFDLVISTDVLYHKRVNDQAAICEIYRVLKKGGFVIVHVPAYNFLRRHHDERVHTEHRYSKTELFYKMKKGRFEVKKISYRNVFLLPFIAFLSLLISKGNRVMNSDLKYDIGSVGSLLYGFLKIENRLLKKINLPFGTSVFCVAQKSICHL